MSVGDSVLISPQVTHKSDWTAGKVIDIEDNSSETPAAGH